MEQIIQGKEYISWRCRIEAMIEHSKLKAVMSVNEEMLSLYWKIGNDILEKQKTLGWGAQVIHQLSTDLTRRFPDDRGYSERNLRHMKRFADAYPQFPIWQVPLAKLKELPISQSTIEQLKSSDGDFLQVPLAKLSWYHHISLLPKMEGQQKFEDCERARSQSYLNTIPFNHTGGRTTIKRNNNTTTKTTKTTIIIKLLQVVPVVVIKTRAWTQKK